MKIAVEGCAHGDLDRIYETIEHAEKVKGVKVDLLLICGDFQAVRNQADLECLACPKKFRAMKDFYKYYSGEKQAPILTIFIGGNHEASNHLLELYHGGWVAPNIYFLGFGGVVRYGGIRIGGLSGIYKSGDYKKGHFEKPPFDERSIRSAYHVRAYDVWKMKQIYEPMDIFLSHDWPSRIAFHGDKDLLLRKKKFLKEEVERNELGSPPNREVMDLLKPSYWFSAHLHVKFPAVVRHTDPTAPNDVRATTKFLALSKCLPGQDYLQIVDIPNPPSPLVFEYDLEWLAILRLTDPFFSSDHYQGPLPVRFSPDVIECEKAKVRLLIPDLTIPTNFEITAPAYQISNPNIGLPAQHIASPQTIALLKKLELSEATLCGLQGGGLSNFSTTECEAKDPNEINIDDIDSDDAGSTIDDSGKTDMPIGPSPRSPGTVKATTASITLPSSDVKTPERKKNPSMTLPPPMNQLETPTSIDSSNVIIATSTMTHTNDVKHQQAFNPDEIELNSDDE